MRICFDILVCPYCKSTLEVTTKGLTCLKHKKVLAVEENLIRINSTRHSFFMLPKDRETKFIEDVKNANSLEELKRLVSQDYDSLYRYIFDRKRSDFLYLLSNITHRGVDIFLDIGAGYGNIITHLSDKTRCAYALDAASEKILFTTKRSLLEGKSVINILSSGLSLPFENSVDIALMNGVFEWIGEFEQSYEKVEEAQLDALRKTRDALKTDGTLVISIENRYNPYYIFEREHGGLRFTSFLPRIVANFISKLLKKKPYRTYTYNYWEYLRLLNKAGFKSVKVFGCFPNYRFPRFTYSLEDGKAIDFLASHKHLHTRISYALFKISGLNLALARLFSPSFVIFASKKKVDTTSSFVGDLAISGLGNFVRIINLGKGQVTSVLREPSLRKIFDSLESRPSHPITLNSAEIELNRKQGYSVGKLIDGETLETIIKRDRNKGLKLIRKAFDLLYDFHSTQKYSPIPIKEYLESLQDSLRKYKALDSISPYIERLGTIDFNSELGKTVILVPYVHGDFYINNILYSESLKDLYVIDWEYGRRACGLYDILYFITLYSYNENKDEFLVKILRGDLLTGDIEELLNQVLRKYLDWIQIGRKALQLVFSIFLLERLLVLLDMEYTTFDAKREFRFLLWANRLLEIAMGKRVAQLSSEA